VKEQGSNRVSKQPQILLCVRKEAMKSDLARTHFQLAYKPNAKKLLKLHKWPRLKRAGKLVGYSVFFGVKHVMSLLELRGIKAARNGSWFSVNKGERCDCVKYSDREATKPHSFDVCF
jgi:hypothetical protein